MHYPADSHVESHGGALPGHGVKAMDSIPRSMDRDMLEGTLFASRETLILVSWVRIPAGSPPLHAPERASGGAGRVRAHDGPRGPSASDNHVTSASPLKLMEETGG